MTADLRAVRRNDWEDVAELVRHAGTIHQNAAFNRIRAALASTPEPAPVAEGLDFEVVHRLMAEDPLMPPCEGTHHMGYGTCQRIVALVARAASPSPETAG